MTKFKVGDSVECVEKYCHITVGMTGIVRVVDGGMPPILVKWDQFEEGHDGGYNLHNNGYWVYPNNLKPSVYTLENE